MISELAYFRAINIVNEYNRQTGNISNHLPQKDLGNPELIKITDIGLTVRLFNAIKKYDDYMGTNTVTVSDISLICYAKFKRVKNIGAKSIKELDLIIKSYGIKIIL